MQRQVEIALHVSLRSLPTPVDYSLEEYQPFAIYRREILETVGGRLVRQARPVASEFLRRLVRDLLATLQAIHRLGVVHGQINPRHVMLDPDNEIVLLGLGRCRPIGSFKWSRGEVVGPADDVLGVGKLILHLVGESARRSPLIRAILAETPADRPSVDELLNAFGGRSLFHAA